MTKDFWNKIEQYKVSTTSDESSDSFWSDIEKYKEDEPEKLEIPWIGRFAKSLVTVPDTTKFIGKKLLKGAANTIDLLTALKDPKLIEDDYIYSENPKEMADLGDLRAYVKDKYNIDLDPLPKNAFENIAGNAAEWAGGSIVPIGGAAGKATKEVGKGVVRLIDGFKKTGNAMKVAGAAGATSGVLQELGAPPLVADVTAIAAPSTLKSVGGRLIDRFTPAARKNKANLRAKEILSKQIGDEEEVAKVLDEIENYKNKPNPLNIDLITPEIAVNPGLSRLYRAKGNSSAISNAGSASDETIKSALSKMQTGIDNNYTKGELLRDHFSNKISDLKDLRSKVSSQDYKALLADPTLINPKTARDILNAEEKIASIGERSLINKYKKALISPDADKALLESIDDTINSINSIDTNFKAYPVHIREQLKAAEFKRLEDLSIKAGVTPAALDRTISELKGKANAALIRGEKNESSLLNRMADAFEEDLKTIPTASRARENYATFSRPINEIEQNDLLNSFVSKDIKPYNISNDFKVSAEKLPEMVVGSNVKNFKALFDQIKEDPEMLNLVKGIYIDDLVAKSTLNSGNLSFDKANKFWNNKANKVKRELIFNADEQAIIEQAIDTMSRKSAIQSMGKVGGSDTAQKLGTENMIDSMRDNFLDLVYKAIPDRVRMPIDVVKKPLKNFFKSNNKENINDIIERVLVSPDEFRDVINTSPRTPTSIIERMSKDLNKKKALAFPVLGRNSD